MVTQILTIETPPLFEMAATQAADVLLREELVVLPTETVYGLAANAFSERAVHAIYEMKGRPAHNPIIVHVASLDMAQSCVALWPKAAISLMRAFWPGPLTLVLPKSERVPSIVTAGGATVGIRWPSHPFMQEVIRRCGFPLAAPSANLANQVSPTMAAHVLQTFEGNVPLLIDAGPSAVGIESTVVDLSSQPPRILRPGIISSEQIKAVLPNLEMNSDISGEDLKSPGLLKKHYSPRARTLLRSWSSDAELFAIARGTGRNSSTIHVIAYEHIPLTHVFGRVSIIPHDAEAYARALYAELHQSDTLGADIILIEEPPHTPEWEGIRDRLKRASAES